LRLTDCDQGKRQNCRAHDDQEDLPQLCFFHYYQSMIMNSRRYKRCQQDAEKISTRLQMPEPHKPDSIMNPSCRRRTRFIVMKPGLNSQFSALWEHQISCENDQGREKET
jgi:hypothetical protein